ncbi:MAG: 50S ribosomal protein L29 [Thermodesulfobacteriota bacterium]
MKAREIRELSVDELRLRENELKQELFNLKFQHGTNQLENPMRIKQTQRDIARVLTIIKEKERAAARSEG